MTTKPVSKFAAIAVLGVALYSAACSLRTQSTPTPTPASSPSVVSSTAAPTPTTEQPSPTPHQSKNGETKTPIVTMLVAAPELDTGRPLTPTFTFDAQAPGMMVLVQVGQITNAPLDLVWYQVTDSGQQKLFEHTVQVAAFDWAYSIGKNPGALASGTYKVVASLQGQTQSVEFDVTQKAATGGAPVSAQQGQPPVDGGSGETASPVSPTSSYLPTPQSAAGCQVSLLATKGGYLVTPPTDWTADTADVRVWADCAEGGDLDVYGSVDGGERPVGEMFTTAGSAHDTTFHFDPCSVPGGSDLPGTTVGFRVIKPAGVGTGGTPIANYVITLGDDSFAPQLDVFSTPARGTKVKPGDKITLNIKATELRSGESWQSGVMDIQVTADPGGLVTSKDYLEYRGKSCDAKSWEQKLDATYTVPSNPPPIITLCVITEDFAGKQDFKCGEFPTGNTWNGKVHLVSSVFGPNGSSCTNETWDGEFYAVVSGGEVQGKGSAHLVAQCVPTSCIDQATQAKFDVSGTFNGRQFRLQFSESAIDGATCGLANYTFFLDPASFASASDRRSPPDFTVPVIAPGDAEAKLSNSVSLTTAALANGQFTFAMLCQDCP
jgi:hypothetical protein